MQTIKVSVTCTAFNDFKEGFVNRIREKILKKISDRQYNFLGRAYFGWVGKPTFFLRSA